MMKSSACILYTTIFFSVISAVGFSASPAEKVLAGWQASDSKMIRDVDKLSELTKQEQLAILGALHTKYGTRPSVIPLEVERSLAKFVIVEQARLKDPKDTLHGGLSLHEAGPLIVAADLLTTRTEEARVAAEKLARNRSVDMTVRIRATEILKDAGNEEVLAVIGDDMLRGTDSADRAVGLLCYLKMAVPPECALPVIQQEILAPSARMRELLVASIPRPNMNSGLVGLCLEICKALPDQADLLLPAVADASPTALKPHVPHLRELLQSTKLGSPARIAAEQAIKKADNR
ncbi:MAG: hypothetical protein N2111_14025 [Candidatus Sumerlaeaceae bacterium]|nr:hypothetical protein [Candidatus Sumerlaeaceae bacterium]